MTGAGTGAGVDSMQCNAKYSNIKHIISKKCVIVRLLIINLCKESRCHNDNNTLCVGKRQVERTDNQRTSSPSHLFCAIITEEICERIPTSYRALGDNLCSTHNFTSREN